MTGGIWDILVLQSWVGEWPLLSEEVIMHLAGSRICVEQAVQCFVRCRIACRLFGRRRLASVGEIGM